jgi:hypothetical protein
MDVSNSEKKFISKHIRKDRRISFKNQTIIWGIISIIFLVLIPLSFLYKSIELISLVVFLWLISFSLCSINYLCNIIKKYDDKLTIGHDKDL